MTDFWQRLAAAPFRELLELTSDPDGCRVYLSRETWAHILDGHAGMVVYQDLLHLAISGPERVEAEDPWRSVLYYYRRDPQEQAKRITDPTLKCIIVIIRYIHPPEWRFARTGVIRTAWSRRGMRRR